MSERHMTTLAEIEKKQLRVLEKARLKAPLPGGKKETRTVYIGGTKGWQARVLLKGQQVYRGAELDEVVHSAQSFFMMEEILKQRKYTESFQYEFKVVYLTEREFHEVRDLGYQPEQAVSARELLSYLRNSLKRWLDEREQEKQQKLWDVWWWGRAGRRLAGR